MKPIGSIANRKSLFLLLIFLLSIGSIFIVKSSNSVNFTASRSRFEQTSIELTEKWFDVIIAEKNKRGIHTDAVTNIRYKEMLGEDFSTITTTLGSLEAKELSTNPEFAALITKYLLESKIDSNSTVGVTLSGSFPALAVAALASLQTLHANVILFSSLGASSYGANQTKATWIDIENWLRRKGGLIYQTNILTPGAEDDNGGGLKEEGFEEIKTAANRNNQQLYYPKNLNESINTKLSMQNEAKIDLLINIGGNQASMGSCVHSLSIPNGLNKGEKLCNCKSRGIVSRLSEIGVPFLQLLNIRDLAVKNGIPLNPSLEYGESSLIDKARINKLPIYFMLLLLITGLIFYKLHFQKITSNREP